MASAYQVPIYIASDMLLQWKGAKADGDYLNAATVSWSLTDFEDTAVASGTLSYQTGTNGNYAGVVADTVTGDLTPNATYYLYVTLTEGDYDDYRRLECRATYRRDQ